MDWELKRRDEGFGLGAILYVSPRDNYRGYPTGMGGRVAIARSEFKNKSDGLVQLGTDWFDQAEGSQALHSRVIRVTDITITSP